MSGGNATKLGTGRPFLLDHYLTKDELAEVGDTVMTWSITETLIMWSIARVRGVNPDVEAERRTLPRVMVARAEALAEECGDPKVSQLAEELVEHIQRWQHERDLFAHGTMLNPQSSNPWLEKELGEKKLMKSEFLGAWTHAKHGRWLASMLDCLTRGFDDCEDRVEIRTERMPEDEE